MQREYIQGKKFQDLAEFQTQDSLNIGQTLLLRMVKMALNLLFVMQKYVRILH